MKETLDESLRLLENAGGLILTMARAGNFQAASTVGEAAFTLSEFISSRFPEELITANVMARIDGVLIAMKAVDAELRDIQRDPKLFANSTRRLLN